MDYASYMKLKHGTKHLGNSAYAKNNEPTLIVLVSTLNSNLQSIKICFESVEVAREIDPPSIESNNEELL